MHHEYLHVGFCWWSSDIYDNVCNCSTEWPALPDIDLLHEQEWAWGIIIKNPNLPLNPFNNISLSSMQLGPKLNI